MEIDRFGRSVLNLSQQLAALTSYGVRFHRREPGARHRRLKPLQQA